MAVMLLVTAPVAAFGSSITTSELPGGTCNLRSNDGDVETHTFILPEHSVAVDMPTSHELSGSSGQWYVFGYLDGEPLVPDVTLYFVAGSNPADIIAKTFPGSSVRTIERDHAAELLLVSSPGSLPDGTNVYFERYVVPVADGIVVAERYENFDWACFQLVALSLRPYSEP